TTDSILKKIGTLVLVALIFGVINAVIRPIVKTIGCAFYILTLGLIALVVNGLLFLLTGWIAGQLDIPFEVHGVVTAILGARIVWSLVFVAAVLFVLRRWRRVGELLRRPRTLALVTLAAFLLAANWATYIYGVNSGHVVETSLGYFINPLVSVVFGLIVFAER